jgi:glutathione synthase/RimK-type ligase-like ATP-grasp enzyme
MKLGILKSYPEIDPLVESYRQACDACNVESVVLDLFADDWIEQIKQAHVDGVLVREKANISEYKEMYNERLWVIKHYLQIPIYPSWHELFLYENKRMYAYFFETHGIRTPKTHVFYSKEEAMAYCNKTSYPIVVKTCGGAAGSGVSIVRKKSKAKRIIRSVFGRFDPRLALGYVHFAKVGGFIPVPKLGMSQRHYLIIQEYIDIETEWRIIKLGDTYAGYIRPTINGYGSSELLEYGFPPKKLLFLIKEITEANRFDSLSLDVLIGKDGEYYITEMQSLFGLWTPHQCEVDGVGGKIEFRNGDFVFVEGEDCFKWNGNLLRVQDFINKLNSNYYNNKDIVLL